MSSGSGATYSVPLLTTTSQASGSSISIISPTPNPVSPPPTVPSASQAVSPPPPTVPSASQAVSPPPTVPSASKAVSPPPTVPSASQAVSPPPPTVPSASQAVSPPPPTVPSASQATSTTFQDDSLEEYPVIGDFLNAYRDESGAFNGLPKISLQGDGPEENSPEGNGIEEDDSNELIKTLYDMYEIVMELNTKVDSIVISKEAVAAVTMACNGSSRDSSSDTGISNLDIKLSALDDKINTMTRVLQSLKTPYGDSGTSAEGQEGGQRRKKGATQKKKRG